MYPPTYTTIRLHNEAHRTTMRNAKVFSNSLVHDFLILQGFAVHVSHYQHHTTLTLVIVRTLPGTLQATPTWASLRC